MKTIDEFIKEVEASEALKNELKAIKDKDATEAFLKKNDVDATVEVFAKVLNANKPEGEISDNDTESEAGGWLEPKYRCEYEYYCGNINCSQRLVTQGRYFIEIGNMTHCRRCGQPLKKGKPILF